MSMLARAQQPRRTVGVLLPQRQSDNPQFPAFVAAMHELGYDDGANIRIVIRSAEGRLDRLPLLASQLVAERPDIIVALNGPGTRAAMNATRSIPVVMIAVADPVGLGFAKSLARPGGNVTGMANVVSELGPKRLSVLKELVPGAKRIAALYNPDDPITTVQRKDIEAVASSFEVAVRFYPVKARNQLAPVFEQLRAWPADAGLWLLGQQAAFQEISARIALRLKFPLMVTFREYVERGGLISYLSDSVEVHRRAASYVDRILKGANPADLPIEQPTRYELLVNARTAKAIGLTIPQSLLARADYVFQ